MIILLVTMMTPFFNNHFCDSNNSTFYSDYSTSDYVDSISNKDVMSIMSLLVNLVITILTVYGADYLFWDSNNDTSDYNNCASDSLIQH